MTWSIVAKDSETGFFGIAIASKFFAIGAFCPWASPDVGAVSTQALVNPTLGPQILELMRDGHCVDDIVTKLTDIDQGIEARQVHFVDRNGNTAARTGSECVEWCGHVAAAGVSVAGNMLAGADVVTDTLDAYLSNAAQPLVERLLMAMKAGEAAGGDKRGKQGAAILIQGPEIYPSLDLRVDDHAAPLSELTRLYEIAKARSIPFSLAFPTAARPHGITDRGKLEAMIEREAGKPLGQARLNEND